MKKYQNTKLWSDNMLKIKDINSDEIYEVHKIFRRNNNIIYFCSNSNGDFLEIPHSKSIKKAIQVNIF